MYVQSRTFGRDVRKRSIDHPVIPPLRRLGQALLRRIETASLVRTSHIRIVPSHDPDNNFCPSGVKAMVETFFCDLGELPEESSFEHPWATVLSHELEASSRPSGEKLTELQSLCVQ